MARAPKSPKSKAAETPPLQSQRASPGWLKPLTLAFAAIVLFGWFSTEANDSDAWWHLKTGEYIWQQHKLPVPDPFAWTTYLGGPAYPGEEQVRYFNLTHEWLAQLVLYWFYAAGGFPGLILFRAAMLAAFCGAAGLLAYHRSGGFFQSIAAALLAAGVAMRFASDRPFLFGFLFLAVTIVLLEYRRWLWVLPPMFAVWANSHGGYFLGWVPLGVYCVEAWLRREPIAVQRRLWIASGAAIFASGLNPNGFRAIQVLVAYSSSPMQSALLEWQHTAFWELDWFGVLLFGTAAVLALSYRKVRPADWMLFVLFAGAGIWAVRNVILVGFLGPVLLAAYIPWKRALPRAAMFAVPLLLAGITVYGIARGSTFQLRAARWRYPDGAARFLLSNRIPGRLFNTYDDGGFLIWRMWPHQQVFIDGRALNESLYPDYQRIVRGDETLLAKYGIDIILIQGFDSSGSVYVLPAVLSDPAQKEWK